jgi:hypothetical protein
MSAADNINKSQRRGPSKIQEDRQALIAHVTEKGGANVRPPAGASRSDINALVRSGQLTRTVKKEYDTYDAPHFGNGRTKISAVRQRAYLHLPENPATEVNIGTEGSNSSKIMSDPAYKRRMFDTANELHRNMKATQWSLENTHHTDPNFDSVADLSNEAEGAYEDHTQFLQDYPDLHGVLKKHEDEAWRGLHDY